MKQPGNLDKRVGCDIMFAAKVKKNLKRQRGKTARGTFLKDRAEDSLKRRRRRPTETPYKKPRGKAARRTA